jgi:septal ring factor EnvC (AmiA/AmiB activator)
MEATRLHLAAALFAASVGVAFGSPRTDAASRLQKAEQQRLTQETQLQAAARALQDAQAEGTRLADQRVRATAALRTTEDSVVDAALRLQRAQTAQGDAEAALKQRAAAFSALVPMMLRMSRYPAETVLAIPVPPDEALEGLLVTRGIAASLNREAASLRAAEQYAVALQAQTSREAATLAARRRVQQAQAASLDRDVAAAQAKISDAEREGQAAAQRVAALAAQAQTLRDAIAAMDTARASAAARAAQDAKRADNHRQPGAASVARATEAALTRPSLKQGMGRMVAPVAGSIVRRFGADEAGEPATGITYGVAPSAFVASPCAGRVGFAAPFRSYGKLVIIECAGGYDWVLAGLEKIVAHPGSAVRAGEPIGEMPDLNPGNTGATGSRPGLYVELRSHGEPIDPTPFLNAKS